MNFSAICKNFFCLLILFALMGCEKLKSSSKKILPNPPDPVEAFHLENITEDHAIVSLDGRCMKLTNAQGKELGWGKNQLGDPVWPPEGDMGYFEYRLSGLEPAFEAVVSYSETFRLHQWNEESVFCEILSKGAKEEPCYRLWGPQWRHQDPQRQHHRAYGGQF